MTPSGPIVVRKSLFGLFVIFTVGFLLTTALLVGLAYNVDTSGSGFNNPMVKLLAIAAVLVVLGTFVAGYVYLLSKIVITDDALTVTSWSSLFFVNTAVTEARHINDVDVIKSGIFSQIGDFGTLLVSTASGERNLKLALIPNVEHVRDLIAARADAATTPVTETAP